MAICGSTTHIACCVWNHAFLIHKCWKLKIKWTEILTRTQFDFCCNVLFSNFTSIKYSQDIRLQQQFCFCPCCLVDKPHCLPLECLKCYCVQQLAKIMQDESTLSFEIANILSNRLWLYIVISSIFSSSFQWMLNGNGVLKFLICIVHKWKYCT